ncbi:MAG: prolipoprotein diacylglyceryl transferase [Lachnospiraceae bacterium]|nr:prolipoprotein diacylglyceryl transferase [Lachnospiraceae bacterium]
MCVFFNVFGMKLPAYGCMISLGLIVANLIAIFGVVEKKGVNRYDFLILEGYSFLFGILGAKLLYFVVSFKDIDWKHFFEPQYFMALLNGGFVFYGGLILGIFGCWLGGKIHKINSREFAYHAIFIVPMIHAFGRVGCFFAGCCYGIPYNGPLAVVYPESPFSNGAPAGIPLFPMPLVEASCLLIIALLIMILDKVKKDAPTVSVYLILYAIVRFVLENYRYDEIRGIYFGLSTSQWISIGMMVAGIVLIPIQYCGKKAKARRALLGISEGTEIPPKQEEASQEAQNDKA